MDITTVMSRIAAKKLRAMIVDDVPFNHVILKNFLMKLGVEVVSIAVNGLEAYTQYEKHVREGNAPHIITMDLEMPVMDGKQASQKIREMEARKGLNKCFLAIVSGNCSESETYECLSREGVVKADSFLKKPLKLENLFEL